MSHLDMSLVALPIAGERQVGEHEIDGGKTAVQVVIDLSKVLVESGAHFFTLQRSGSSADGDLRGASESIDGA